MTIYGAVEGIQLFHRRLGGIEIPIKHLELVKKSI